MRQEGGGGGGEKKIPMRTDTSTDGDKTGRKARGGKKKYREIYRGIVLMRHPSRHLNAPTPL